MADDLTAHDHSTRVDGCFRCDLSADEAIAAADEAEDRIERLEAWKASALYVLAEWDETWKAAGEPGPLGGSKAENVRRRIAELEDDAKYLGQRTVQMHRQAMERAREAEAERDAALADVAKLREALWTLAHKVQSEAANHRYGTPRYDMTLDDLAEYADAALADTEEAKSDG